MGYLVVMFGIGIAASFLSSCKSNEEEDSELPCDKRYFDFTRPIPNSDESAYTLGCESVIIPDEIPNQQATADYFLSQLAACEREGLDLLGISSPYEGRLNLRLTIWDGISQTRCHGAKACSHGGEMTILLEKNATTDDVASLSKSITDGTFKPNDLCNDFDQAMRHETVHSLTYGITTPHLDSAEEDIDKITIPLTINEGLATYIERRAIVRDLYANLPPTQNSTYSRIVRTGEISTGESWKFTEEDIPLNSLTIANGELGKKTLIEYTRSDSEQSHTIELAAHECSTEPGALICIDRANGDTQSVTVANLAGERYSALHCGDSGLGEARFFALDDGREAAASIPNSQFYSYNNLRTDAITSLQMNISAPSIYNLGLCLYERVRYSDCMGSAPHEQIPDTCGERVIQGIEMSMADFSMLHQEERALYPIEDTFAEAADLTIDQFRKSFEPFFVPTEISIGGVRW